MAVSVLPVSSLSSIDAKPSRPLTLLTRLYNSTKDFGSRTRHFVGTSYDPDNKNNDRGIKKGERSVRKMLQTIGYECVQKTRYTQPHRHPSYQ